MRVSALLKLSLPNDEDTAVSPNNFHATNRRAGRRFGLFGSFVSSFSMIGKRYLLLSGSDPLPPVRSTCAQDQEVTLVGGGPFLTSCDPSTEDRNGAVHGMRGSVWSLFRLGAAFRDHLEKLTASILISRTPLRVS